MDPTPPEERDPLVPDERIPGSFYEAASAEPAWDRAHHDIAAERYWGLRDYYISAAIREHVQGEAPGDRAPSPLGPAAIEAARYFAVVVPRWGTGRLPGEMHEAAFADPARSRAETGGPDDIGLGWADYLRSAAIRQATQGEAPGDRPASPAGPAAAEAARYFETTIPHWRTARLFPGEMYEAASSQPALSRAETSESGDTGFGWSDYLRSAAIRLATQGEGGADLGRPPSFDLDTELGAATRAGRADAARNDCPCGQGPKGDCPGAWRGCDWHNEGEPDHEAG